MHTHMHKPRETNQTHLKFLVIVLTWAGLMDSPAIVLDLPRVAIPGKILATKAISVQRLSFTVFFYPLGRAKALGLLQKSCMSSESCNIAMNVLPHFILSFHSETGTAWVMKFLSPTVGLTEAGAGVMHSIDRHAGVFDEKVFHRTGFHLDSG